MIIYLSLLIAIVGLLVYVLSAQPKIMEVGRIMLGTGLLAFLLCVCNHVVALPGTR